MYQYTTISFPGLGLELNPPRILELGPLTIHFYGLVIATGLILAAIYGMKRSKQFGLNEDLILDGVLWVTPFAILCARAYYCIFSWPQYRDNPISMLYIWEGGLAIYGGVLGAIAGVLVYCKWKKISVGAVLDVVALGFLIGQAMGRWGNFFNREAFGAETECFLRMGLYNTVTQTFEYHHPTFLYESLWNLAGFVMLHFASKHRRYDGQIALGYVAWYGLGRAWIEGLRTDSLYIGSTGIRVSQLLAAASCAVAVIILVYFAMKRPSADKLFVNRVAQMEKQKEQEQEKEQGGQDHE